MESKKPLSICIKCAHTPICKNQPQPSCSYFSLKPDPSTRPKPEPKTSVSPSPQKSFLRRLWTWCLWVLVIGLMIGSFLAGQYSVRTQIVTSLIPPQTAPPNPNATPDQVVQHFFESLIHKDTQGILSACHPDMNSYKKAEFVEYARGNHPDVTYTAIEIVSQELDESAKVMLTYTLKNRDYQKPRSRTGYVLLKKHQGQWMILDL